ASDVDVGTTLSVTGVPASLPAGVSYDGSTHSFTLDPSNGAYQHLGAGQTTDVTVSYGVSDGTATTVASVKFTVTGTNDAPVVTGAVTGNATEDAAVVTLNALANASDVDDGTTLSVTGVPASLPAGGTYDSAGSAAARERFTVAGANDAPVLSGAQATLVAGTEDVAYTVSAANLLAGFTDVDGDTLSVSALTANHGTVVDNGNGTFTVTPT